jgi:hypothetical protein
VPLALPVFVTEYGSAPWHATSVDVSTHAMKLRPRDPVQPGHAVRLTFTLPDGGNALTVMSVLMREDAEGLTFYFVNPTTGESHRLAAIVRRLHT